MITKVISLLSFGLILLACNSELIDNPNASPLNPAFFYELVDEEGLNFFTANPDISFEEVKVMGKPLPGSGAEDAGLKLIDCGYPMIVNGRKVITASSISEVYIFFSNGQVDVLNHWRDSDKKKKNRFVWWYEDPIYYYSYNGIYQGKFDVFTDELHIKNNIEDPVRFDPQIAVIKK